MLAPFQSSMFHPCWIISCMHRIGYWYRDVATRIFQINTSVLHARLAGNTLEFIWKYAGKGANANLYTEKLSCYITFSPIGYFGNQWYNAAIFVKLLSYKHIGTPVYNHAISIRVWYLDWVQLDNTLYQPSCEVNIKQCFTQIMIYRNS